MKKLAVLIVAAAVLAGFATGYAQCGAGGCAVVAGVNAACPCGPCGAALDKMKLTDEQKEKLATLTAECSKVECPKARKVKYCSTLTEILTPKQLAQVKAACQKADAKDCPLLGASGGGCSK